MDLVERQYRDALGHSRTVGKETLERIRQAQGPAVAEHDAVRIVRAGRRVTFNEPADLVLENGSRERLGGSSRRAAQKAMRLPGDIPLGYHTLEFHDSARRMSLIVAPRQCHLPAGLRIWAWAIQLYAARSQRSWGIGDFGDLARFAAISRDQGCRLLLVNPLHAATPALPQEASPYSPTTRRYLNPLYLAIEELPGARAMPDFHQIVTAGRSLSRAPLIDRDRVYRLKLRTLEALYRSFDGDGDFDTFTASEGPALREYATFCALVEEHGPAWRQWPAKLRHPLSADVRRFADAHAGRIRFHQWMQWHLDRQLRRAAASVPVMQDLPIGIDAEGADAWAWQDILAKGIHVGAPPDEFNTKGQDWGLPPFIPERLRSAAYRPFIETIRGTMRHAGGLRIDHVMGLFRLFWIPEGMSPADGAYVRNFADDLLAIIALESERAQAIIVGEDLGTVDPKARKALAAMNILSYRLLWFERDDPSRYPERALAAVTTHDLPTVAGLWRGSDLDAQRRLQLNPNEAGMREMRERLARATGSTDLTPVREVIRRTYTLLAKAPSVVVAATLEDAAAVAERPNMPGTVTEWPNWKQPLPRSLDSIARSAQAKAIANALSSRGPRQVRSSPRRPTDTRRRRRAA